MAPTTVLHAGDRQDSVLYAHQDDGVRDAVLLGSDAFFSIEDEYRPGASVHGFHLGDGSRRYNHDRQTAGGTLWDLQDLIAQLSPEDLERVLDLARRLRRKSSSSHAGGRREHGCPQSGTLPHDRSSGRRHVRTVPPLPRPAPRDQGPRTRRWAPWVGCSAPCCACSRMEPPMSAWPPITSSSRFATISGPATRPVRGWSGRFSRSSRRSKMPWWPWASGSGPWSTWRRTTPWPPPPVSRPPTGAWRRSVSGRRTKTWRQCVRGDRVVQVDSRTGTIRDADAVRKKFGVEPSSHPGLPGAGR